MHAAFFRRTALALGVAAIVAAGYTWHSSHPAAAAPPASATPSQVLSSSLRGSLPDFSALVERNGPAVVNISTSGTLKTGAAASPFGGLDPDDPFSEFFRRFAIPRPQGQMPTHGLGSGFIVRGDGVVLTNAHVVADASDITVRLTDKREFKAKVLGMDRATDIAVLKVEAKDLPTVRLGDPQQAKVGEWVVAIGSPFGFENSVTAGIISAKTRSLPEDNYVPFLQTDVAVNPGNSGGPLFNTDGEVIGINSQIYSRSGGYQGLSFAIPIDVAMKTEGQILAHGHVTRGLLGASVQGLTPSLAQAFGLPKPSGALVAAVEKDGPAARAGLQPGDVILALNGTPLESSAQLPLRIADLAPGTRATLEIWRKGGKKNLTVEIAARNETAADTETATQPQQRLGLAVRPLQREEQRQSGIDSGLVVEDSSGPAARAGVQPGDILLSLNGEPVSDVAQLRSLAAKAGKHVALLVQRDGERLFLPLDLG